MKDIERQAYFRTGRKCRRCPQGPDPALSKPTRDTFKRLHSSFENWSSRSFLKTICSILHRISAFQVSRHYLWNISLREWEPQVVADSRHAWLWQPQTKLYWICTEGISLFLFNVYRTPKSLHGTNNKQEGAWVALWSCKAQGRTFSRFRPEDSVATWGCLLKNLDMLRYAAAKSKRQDERKSWNSPPDP